jgi:Zn-dependent protease
VDELSLVQKLVVWALPVLLAVTLHEVAHGWVARRLGDYTAAMLGRLSWNPLKHIDPVGTLLVPGLLFLAGGFIFGWAKPVPVVWENLKHPKRDMALVALAGPLANLCMLLGWLVVIKIAAALGEGLRFFAMPLIHMGFAGIMINSMLMALNLLPLPPLDGSRVVAALLPGRLSWMYQRIEPYGLIILLLLMMSGLLGKILYPALSLIEAMAQGFIGL